MSRKEALQKLYDRLLVERNDLRRKLAAEAGLNDLPSSRGDFADVANADVENELSQQLKAMGSRELAQIEKALHSMREGNYGNCEGCNKAIPITRLKAVPDAATCIECQTKQEELGYTAEQAEADWESAFRNESSMSDREFSMNDIEIDR
ncbi:General stress protein 16O [Polystyrenella longa]|uniref:General stress protein 16O n=1 Tax=Polystyrenella longa TaxID=2528007 RepID=A0A518CS92_9PLAN|nr:TraR/DksA family transcriptional regulator [Polystyrenella longa]QDU82088.1 General stress protein 16O [Polystyrenella longa]